MNSNLNVVKNYPQLIKILSVIFAGILFGNILLSYPLLYTLTLVLFLLVIAGIAIKPEIGIIILTIATTTLISISDLPTLTFGFGGLFTTDIIIIYMFSLIIIRKLYDKNYSFIKTPLDLPLLLLFLAATISVFVAILKFNVAQDIAIRNIRWMVYYLTFFLTTNLIRDKKQLLFVINSILVIGTIVASLMIIQSLLGQSVELVLKGKISTLTTAGEEFLGATRVVIPGKEIVYFSLFLLICNLLFNPNDKYKLVRIVQIIILSLAIVLLYSRNIYFSILITLGILIFMLSNNYRKKIFIRGIVTILILLITIPALGSISDKLHIISDSFSQRFISLFESEKRQETIDYRYWEIPFAVEKIYENPVLGIGIGNSYRPGRHKDDPGQHIHNAFLYVWMYMGLVGLIAFLWLFIKIIRRGLKYWYNIDDPFLRAVVLGISLGFLGMMMRNFTTSVLVGHQFSAFFGTIIGISEVAFRINRTPPTSGNVQNLNKKI